MSEAELKQARLEAQGRLNEALTEEASAPHGTPARDEARQKAAQAQDDIAKIDARIARPQDYEERVVLVAPTQVSRYDSTLDVEWVDGRAELPKSVAERLVSAFPGYEIEEG